MKPTILLVDRSACRTTSVVALSILCLCAHSDANANDRYEASFGIGTTAPIDDDLRDAFPRSTAVSLSLASRVEGRAAWVFAECGWESSSGSPYADDGTFDIDDSKLRRVPLAIGMRLEIAPRSPQPRLTTALGYGVSWAFLTWTPPLGESETKSTFGVFLELRTAYQFHSSYGLWFRPRLSHLFETDFDALPDVQPSSVGIDIGFSYSFTTGKGDPS